MENGGKKQKESALLLSVVIPTRNEARNVALCIASFDQAKADGWCEVLVVDNASDDETVSLAEKAGAAVFQQGPERSAQRNRGFKEARGRFVCFLDADMRVPQETVEEIHSLLLSREMPDALYIREVRVGKGWWIKVRNFERSFYDATCIDGLRVIRRDVFERVGGFDVTLSAFEDWDLDRRILDSGATTGITRGALLHDEGAFSLRRHLKKKTYYSGYYDSYREKWHNDAMIRKQLGIGYRFFGVFLENGKWKRALRHPLLMASLYFERFLVGLCLLTRRRADH